MATWYGREVINGAIEISDLDGARVRQADWGDVGHQGDWTVETQQRHVVPVSLRGKLVLRVHHNLAASE